mgnify:CR=1 FL=1
MSVNGVTQSQANAYTYASSASAENTKTTSATDNKSTAADTGVVYEPSKKTSTASTKKTYTPDTKLINKLKADADARTSQLRSLVEKMMSGQANAYGNANDIWSFLRKGDYKVDPATRLQAQQDISEDGYWGVNQTSDRIVSFATALTGGDPDKIEEIETVSYSALAAAYLKVKDAVEAAGGYVGCSPLPNDYFVGHPEEVGFREHAQEIPMVVGSVFGEMAFNPGVAQKYEKTREEQIAIVRETFGDATEDIVAKYEAAYPGQNLIDILSLDCFTRTPTVNYVKKKASYGKAPVYNYLFNYEFPYQDGKRPWHCSDLPFFFHNTDKVMICNKPGVSDALEQKMSTLLTNFAKYGDPNHSSLPRWEPSTKESVNTMILDEKCEVRVNFDTEVINAVKPLIPNPFQRKRTADDIALR